jgi:DNA polymerase-3 subunit epsilon
MVNQDGVSLYVGMKNLLNFIGEIPFVGYNVGYDAGFLMCAADQHRLSLRNPYVDVLEMVREVYPDLPSHKLEDIAEVLNLSNKKAHRALADCRRTLAVFRHVVDMVKARYEWQYPCDLPVIEPNQARPASYAAFLNHVAEDVQSRHGNADGHLWGQTVVFTGDLSIPRQQAVELAVAAGCNVSPNVNRRTTILVSGIRDASLYNGKLKSGKTLKAEELIAKGVPLRIVSEAGFIKLVNAG